MDLLHAHLCEQLFTGAGMDERVIIRGDALYSHPLLTINYTTYNVRREKDSIHLNFGNHTGGRGGLTWQAN